MAIKSFYSKGNNSNSVIESMVIGRQDQREFLRMNVQSKITFKIQGSEEIYEGTTSDLSATGVRFISRQKVNIGDILNISLKPGVNVTPSLEAALTVIRVSATDGCNYDIAGFMQRAESL